MHINQFKTNKSPSQQSELARGEITKTSKEIPSTEARQTADLKIHCETVDDYSKTKTKKNLC